MKALSFLAIIGFLVPHPLFACSWCKSKGGAPSAAAPKLSATKPTGQVRILASPPSKGPNFSADFFNAIGEEEEEATQPEAIPDGDDGSYKLIFK